MRKLLALPLIAAVACGPPSFPDPSREAMPNKDAVAMGSPSSAKPVSTGSPDQTTQNSTAGQSPAPFFGLTAGVALAFNGGTAIMLGIVESVTSTEPTSCTTNSCTWGPGSSALDYNTYKLVVTQNGDSFDWELSGQAKSRPASDFVVFMSGKAKPGPQAHHGSGSFQVDFDKAATLDGPHNDTGQLNVTSYSNVGPAHLDVAFNGTKDNDHPGTFDNLVYSYADDAQGGGDLDVAVHNTTTQDRFSVHSRWKNDGHGRADVAGLGSGYSVSLSECWGPAPFAVQFFSSSVKIVVPPFGGPDSGDPVLCAYADAAFSTKTAP
jgi:hypothetical protein